MASIANSHGFLRSDYNSPLISKSDSWLHASRKLANTDSGVIAISVSTIVVGCCAVYWIGKVIYYLLNEQQESHEEFVGRIRKEVEKGVLMQQADATLANDKAVLSLISTAELTNSSFSGIYESEGFSLFSGLNLKTITSISWSALSLSTVDPNLSIIGKGSFGIVVKALWDAPWRTVPNADGSSTLSATHPTSPGVDKPRTSFLSLKKYDKELVAIKILSKSVSASTVDKAIKVQLLKRALHEVGTIKGIENKLKYKDCIVKVYGVAYGPLPYHICMAMNVFQSTEAIGIVMRYEVCNHTLRTILANTICTYTYIQYYFTGRRLAQWSDLQERPQQAQDGDDREGQNSDRDSSRPGRTAHGRSCSCRYQGKTHSVV